MDMKKRYSFRICGLNLALQLEQPIQIQGDMLPFCGDEAALDLLVDGRTTADLSEGEGKLLLRESERLVFRRGGHICRCRATRLNEPLYAKMDYDLAAPNRVQLTVREADWGWSTDHLRLWSTLSLPQLLLHFQTLIFHASYIVSNGRAILFTAPSRTGKSTQAELWRKFRNAHVVNGDKAGVTLRERPMAHGVPFSGTSGICENVSAPLAAVVSLSQAPENTVRRLGPSQAVAALCPNVFVDQAIAEEWALALQLLLDVAASVSVYALACTPDVRAVETLEQALFET